MLLPFMIPYVLAVLIYGSFDYHFRVHKGQKIEETKEPAEDSEDVIDE